MDAQTQNTAPSSAPSQAPRLDQTGLALPGLDPAFAIQIQSCIFDIDAAYSNMMAAFEALPAGAPFTREPQALYERYCAAARTIPEAAEAFGLTPAETALATMAAFGSGLGIMQQYLAAAQGAAAMNDKPFPNPNGSGLVRDHCVRSHDLVRDLISFRLLHESERTAVLQALLFKGSPAEGIPLEEGSLAYKMCYIIRDQDKLAILLTDKDRHYLSAEGIAAAFLRYFAQSWIENFAQVSELAHSPGMLATATGVADRALRSTESCCFPMKQRAIPKSPMTAPLDNPGPTITRAMKFFMERMPSLEAEDAISRGNVVPMEAIAKSHADYLLFQLSLIFDTRSPHVLRTALMGGALSGRIEQLTPRTMGEDMARVVAQLESYLAPRLPDISNVRELIVPRVS